MNTWRLLPISTLYKTVTAKPPNTYTHDTDTRHETFGNTHAYYPSQCTCGSRARSHTHTHAYTHTYKITKSRRRRNARAPHPSSAERGAKGWNCSLYKPAFAVYRDQTYSVPRPTGTADRSDCQVASKHLPIRGAKRISFSSGATHLSCRFAVQHEYSVAATLRYLPFIPIRGATRIFQGSGVTLLPAVLPYSRCNANIR